MSKSRPAYRPATSAMSDEDGDIKLDTPFQRLNFFWDYVMRNRTEVWTRLLCC
jgi:hypothetical protein